ncbi:hypothetical protein H311_00813 [Anncaliia algerae PRA109]|nr:hypothetical protein H311_00813 [Anncaliia algerae PRA109]
MIVFKRKRLEIIKESNELIIPDVNDSHEVEHNKFKQDLHDKESFIKYLLNKVYICCVPISEVIILLSFQFLNCFKLTGFLYFITLLLANFIRLVIYVSDKTLYISLLSNIITDILRIFIFSLSFTFNLDNMIRLPNYSIIKDLLYLKIILFYLTVSILVIDITKYMDKKAYYYFVALMICIKGMIFMGLFVFDFITILYGCFYILGVIIISIFYFKRNYKRINEQIQSNLYTNFFRNLVIIALFSVSYYTLYVYLEIYSLIGDKINVKNE